MRVRVSDPSGVPHLIAFLTSRIDCVAVQASEAEVDVSLLGSYASGARERELERRLEAWQATHEDVDVVLVGTRVRDALRPPA